MKIGWILTGSNKLPSSRIQGWNVHEYMIGVGIDSKIIFAPQEIQREISFTDEKIKKIIDQQYDLVILQKTILNDCLLNLISSLKQANTKTIYITTDVIDPDLVKLTDHTITVNKYYVDQLPSELRTKVSIVFDSYEHDGTRVKVHTKDKIIKLVFLSSKAYSNLPWIDSLPNNVGLTIIGPTYEVAERFNGLKKHELYAESKLSFEYKEWSLQTVYDEIVKCDVGIIPYPKELIGVTDNKNSSLVKSTARAVLMMSLGLPVIASPIETYLDLIKDYENGFIAYSEEDWRKYITYLRDNPKQRAIMGNKAREDVINEYSPSRQGDLYIQIFKNQTTIIY